MPTRREFALTVGAATLGACVRTPSPPPSAPTPTTTPTAPAAADANAPAVDALTELVRHRYGAHLSEAQITMVRDDIRGGLRTSDRLRAILLPNSAEPDVVFTVHRGGDR